MRFWDSSALVQLLVVQNSDAKVNRLLRTDPSILVWWAARVECVSALQRLTREGTVTEAELEEALEKLREMASDWVEVEPAPRVRDTAMRFLRVHALRAADALQLGAAFIASEGNPASLEFVALDRRLCEAASREGFRVLS